MRLAAPAWLSLALLAAECPSSGAGGAVVSTATVRASALPADGARPPAGAYSPRSPHWPHVRTMISDYRVVYRPAGERAAEYDWTAAHYDRVTLDQGDSVSAAEYHRRNPTAAVFRYAILWTVVRPGAERRAEPGVAYYDDMRRWFAAHPSYALERAFLHDGARCPPPAPASEACRVALHIWTQDRWALDPGDEGARAYQRDRFARLAAGADGVFVDEHGSGDIADRLRPLRLREYADFARYERDEVALLGALRAALGGGKRIVLNTAEYTTPWDRAMILSAGGTHGEALNNPLHPAMEERWRFVEALLGGGAWVNLSAGGTELPASYDAGNSATPADRRTLWLLASYYLVVPRDPAPLALNLAPGWDQPFAERWPRAVEVDVGHPLSERRLTFDGADASGARAHVWLRELDRALVLVRPVLARDDDLGEGGAVEVALPPGRAWRPLAPDGSLGAPLARVRLRAGEGAILVPAGTSR